MRIPAFPADKSVLDTAYENIRWIPETGLPQEALAAGVRAIGEDETLPKAIRKAKMFAFILEHAQLAIDKEDIFQDKLSGEGLMNAFTWRWNEEVSRQNIPQSLLHERGIAGTCGVYSANPDYGHISPNTEALVTLGIPGLLKRIRDTRAAKGTLTEEQRVFYDSCECVLSAMCGFFLRLADAVREENPLSAECLAHLSAGAPANLYEALALIELYYVLHERIAGARVRTLGRLDAALYPLYCHDLEAGTFTEDEIFDLWRYFLNKIWSAKVPFDQPFMIGGSDGNGTELTSRLTYTILEAYDSLHIYSPKLHVRISEHTPKEFVLRVLRCIRGGNSSFLLLNEEKAIEGLVRIGIDAEDAKKAVLIGCYESAVGGMEIPCTGNGAVNLAKAVIYVFTRGVEPSNGIQIGPDTGVPETFEEFVSAVKRQISHLISCALSCIRAFEPLYPQIYPDPILSSQMDACVERGVDAYSAGAKYNNSSLNAMGIATLTDSVCAVKKLVYEEKRLTLSALGAILASDWENAEELRADILRLPEKYGNNNKYADDIMRTFSDWISKEITGKPNGRGGVFKAGLYSIDHCFTWGEKTQATPDGRHAGEMLSKNLCAVTCMDKNGITAVIQSAAKIDHGGYPNGTVLDIVLHPTTVAGEDGLQAFYGLVNAYFRLGGFAVHGNVFDAAVLRDAQEHPERYQTLQVRLCGWNVYFVNLTRQEQDDFIRRTDALA